MIGMATDEQTCSLTHLRMFCTATLSRCQPAPAPAPLCPIVSFCITPIDLI